MKNSHVFIVSLLSVLYSTMAQAEKSDTINKIVGNAFFNDAHLDLTLRNHWKYLKENEAQPKAVHNAWGQAATLSFRSGYFNDVIGFDAAYSRAVKLSASDYFATRGLLYNHGSGYEKQNAGGFGRFGQRYVKMKFGDEALGLHAKSGWHELKNVGVITDVYRLAKNSYFGYSGSLHWLNFSADAAYVTRSVMQDSPDRVHFLTADNKEIESVFTTGLNYRDRGESFSWAYGESKDYLRRHLVEVVWPVTGQWTLASQIYASYALDNYKAMPAGKREFDNNAWHYAGEIRWQENKWKQRFGFAWTRAKKENAVGYYDRFMGKNTRGRFNALTSAGKDYMRDGELALTTLTQYELSQGLSAGIQINYGQFTWKNNTVRTGEVTLLNLWKPTDEQLKGLTLATQFGYGWSYKNSKSTPLLNAQGDYMRSPNLSAEVGIEYKFGLF